MIIKTILKGERAAIITGTLSLILIFSSIDIGWQAGFPPCCKDYKQTSF